MKRELWLMKRILCVLCWATLVVVTNGAAAQIISDAEINDCEQTSLGGPLDCEQVRAVTINVAFGKSVTLDAVTITQAIIDGEPVPIEEAVRLEITKTQPRVIYPLRYRHTVNYYPTEEVIPVPNTYPGYQACDDSPAATGPTCGWATDDVGNIPSSQGFCCNKSAELFFGTPQNPWWRGEAELGVQSSLSDSFSTAHCLRMDELWFDGYDVNEGPVVEYSIDIKLSMGSATYPFSLSPAKPVYATASDQDYGGDFHMRAHLMGDLLEGTAHPDFSNRILYIPGTPETHSYVHKFQENMLLVPREEVSFDGSECNKVGVGYAAFRNQAAVCGTTRVDDCLENQLYHKHQADLETLAQDPDAETRYLVHGMKNFKDSMEFTSSLDKTLEYRVKEGTHGSQVVLVIDVDQLELITTESVGSISDAWVIPYESLTNGILIADISNYGELDADYVVSVHDCNMNLVQSIPAQTSEILHGKNKFFSFDVYTVNNIDATNFCWVTVASQNGEIYDKTRVIFDTYKHQSVFEY